MSHNGDNIANKTYKTQLKIYMYKYESKLDTFASNDGGVETYIYI